MTLLEALRNPPRRPMAEWPLVVNEHDYELAVYMDGTANMLDATSHLAALRPASTPEARLMQRLKADDTAYRYPVQVPFPLYFTLRTYADVDAPEHVAQEVDQVVLEIFEKQVKPQLVAVKGPGSPV